MGFTTSDVDDAAARLRRFAPYIAQVFPETKRLAGIIESPLVAVPTFQESVSLRYGKQMIDGDTPLFSRRTERSRERSRDRRPDHDVGEAIP